MTKPNYFISYGDMADLNTKIEHTKNYLWLYRDEITEEEKSILENILSYYLLLETNYEEIMMVQKQ